MRWTEEEIRSIFSRKDFARGKEYFQRGKVSKLEIEGGEGEERVTCTVKGTEAYWVSFQFDGDKVRIGCTCPHFYEKHICKHVAAGMLAFDAAARGGLILHSDSRAQDILRSYLERSSHPQLQSGEARLVPRLYHCGEDAYPSFAFQVGFDRLYVVRDVKAFVERVMRRETASYGKALTLYHGMEQFDRRSRELIALLADQFPAFRSTEERPYSPYDIFEAGWGRGRRKDQTTFTGRAFDQLFDILRDDPVERGDQAGTVMFEEEVPEVSLSLKKGSRGAELAVTTKGDWSFFGSSQSLYAIGNGALLRCGEAFREKVWPLLDGGAGKMDLAFSDLPVLCSCVLPEIRELVELRDPDCLLREYIPDDCTPCFYFDMEGSTLLLRLAFRYGDSITDQGKEPPKSVKRNVLAESAARSLAEAWFQPSGGARFALEGEEAAWDFLTDRLDSFREKGEVFVTDRLLARRVQPSAARVGISVSGGLLSLEIDTGGFPPEELEPLYQSMLKRRRYHRLKDGRYLALDGSSCEKLAEMSHMLQLPAKELARGSLKMPAFRGLYLDGLLADSEGIRVTRDQKFRAMVREFRSISESDHAVPAELEGVLRPYQKVGFQWLKTLESCGFGGILADEMGLGKTVQVIAFLSTADRGRTGLPSLVVCPASLILNWKDELSRFAPALKVSLVMGSADERERRIRQEEESDVWITSYELLRQDIEKYQGRPFYCCILDEGQHIKNQSTLTSKAVKRVECRQRFVLTGTPIENRLSELWNLFDFLMPGYLFSHKSFVEKLEKPVVKSGDQEAAAQLRRLVQPFMLRRLKRDVLKELPPKMEHIRRIPLSDAERRVYHAAASHARQSLGSDGQGKLEILAALTQLRQICCVPGLCFENYDGPNSKLEAALELCAGMVENGHQILLFSQFTTMLDRVRQGLDELGISHFTLQGSTPKEKRAQLVRAFNAGEASVFLISLKAGGTGLNLTAADVVIHYDPWWNMAAQEQATDRAHRIGQQASVQVYKLIAEDTIEERILELQAQKASLMDTISGGEGAGILDMSREDLLALLDE